LEGYGNRSQMQALFCGLTRDGPQTYSPALILGDRLEPACLPRKGSETD